MRLLRLFGHSLMSDALIFIKPSCRFGFSSGQPHPLEQLNIAANRRERRPELMGSIRHEPALRFVRFVKLVIGRFDPAEHAVHRIGQTPDLVVGRRSSGFAY